MFLFFGKEGEEYLVKKVNLVGNSLWRAAEIGVKSGERVKILKKYSLGGAVVEVFDGKAAIGEEALKKIEVEKWKE